MRAFMRDLRACFGAAVHPWFAISIYLLFAVPALLNAVFGSFDATEAASFLWAFGSFLLSVGTGFGVLSLAAESQELRLPSSRALISYGLAALIGIFIAGAMVPSLTVYLLSGSLQPTAFFFGATALGLLIAGISRNIAITVPISAIVIAAAVLLGERQYVVVTSVVVIGVLVAPGSCRWYRLLTGQLVSNRRSTGEWQMLIALQRGRLPATAQATLQCRNDGYFATVPQVATRYSPISRIRMLLGEPYAPTSLRRRLRTAALPLIAFGICVLASILWRHFSPLASGAWPYAALVALTPYFFTLDFHRSLALVLKSRSGTLTELALLPGCGADRTQLRYYYAAILSPAAWHLLLWLCIAFATATLLLPGPHPPLRLLALLCIPYLSLALLTTVEAGQPLCAQGRDLGQAYRGIVAGLPFYISFPAIAEYHGGRTGSISNATFLLVACGVPCCVGLAVFAFRIYRNLAARPHPFVESLS
jgi:hypothetical protein